MARPEVAAALLREQSGTAEDELLDLERLVRHVGAELVYEELGGDVSGVLIREEGRIVIGVNAADVPARQRFTISHEIGHLLLHKGRALVVDPVRINLRDSRSSLATDLEEIEANSFAAELLMPRSLVLRNFRRAADSGPTTLTQMTRDLAIGFGVSEQAMEYRLAHLGLLRPG